MSKAPGEARARPERNPPGLLFHPELAPTAGGTQLDHFSTVLHYGTKAAGLQILPPAWVPAYVVIPAWAYEEWVRERDGWLARLRRRRLDLGLALELVSDREDVSVIVRSSAVGEGLEDRGLYKSLRLDAGARLPQLAAAIEEIFIDFAEQGRHSAIAICLQRHVPPELAGHVSNEVHLSASRNQWKYMISMPAFGPEQGINSKFASAPDELLPIGLASLREIGPTLRRVCNWVNVRVDQRSHLEWCAANGRVWIVQLDQETPTSPGANPHVVPAAHHAHEEETAADSPGVFTQYNMEPEVPWRKLLNVLDFWTGEDRPRHRLFFATGDVLDAFLATESGRSALAAEIDRRTGRRAVLRTDCTDPTISPFNLPRTNTIDGAAAAVWIADTLATLRAKGAALSGVAIILHRYIPARAAAWSYYAPGDEIVRIDGLWGLPDGLQFLSHDSFQVDARSGLELAAAVRFKPNFLQEQDDGTWQYVRVARQYGRDRVLSREALRVMTLETVRIAQKIDDPAHIMWFCDLPAELGMGQYLPWYRSKEFAGFVPAKRPPLPAHPINNLADLAALEQSGERLIISLAPEIQLVRDDETFLDRVIRLARERSLPVELAGSVLGHAYYRLRDAGVLVVGPHPKYDRVRGRLRFYKVVRDDIPHNIAAKGERVSFARLAQGQAAVALIGKLFEEGLEFNSAKAPDQKLEELADVLEVVRGLAVTGGIEWEDLIAAAADKRNKRGGFEQQTVLLETSRPMPRRASRDPDDNEGHRPVIELGDLGVVAVQGARASISFTKLLAGNSIAVELALDGRSVSVIVGLDAAGISLLASEGGAGDIQLHLFGDGPLAPGTREPSQT